MVLIFHFDQLSLDALGLAQHRLRQNFRSRSLATYIIDKIYSQKRRVLRKLMSRPLRSPIEWGRIGERSQ